MSFSDTVFLFFLALILFGPKKLPEMARQAGRLLAELRRASNEFKSQIETEIAHLEVEKRQTVLPPTPAPQGTVASLSSNPAASEPVPLQLESPVSVDASASAAAPAESSAAESMPAEPSGSASSGSASQADAGVDANASTSQESHV